VAVKGTPLQDQEAPSGIDLVRCIATARIVMPKTVVRLSAGRLDLTESDQALAFMAGANSIFDGDKLLTTPNNDRWVLLVWVGVGGVGGGGGGGVGVGVWGGGGALPPPCCIRLQPQQPTARPSQQNASPTIKTTTTEPPPAPNRDADARMFSLLGLKSRPAFMPYDAGNDSSRSFDQPSPAAGASGGAAAAAAEAKGGCCGGGCGSGGEQQQRAAVA